MYPTRAFVCFVVHWNVEPTRFTADALFHGSILVVVEVSVPLRIDRLVCQPNQVAIPYGNRIDMSRFAI